MRNASPCFTIKAEPFAHALGNDDSAKPRHCSIIPDPSLFEGGVWGQTSLVPRPLPRGEGLVSTACACAGFSRNVMKPFFSRKRPCEVDVTVTVAKPVQGVWPAKQPPLKPELSLPACFSTPCGGWGLRPSRLSQSKERRCTPSTRAETSSSGFPQDSG